MAASRFRRSIFRRLTLLSILIATLSVAALYAVTYYVVSDANKRALAMAVDTDIAGLADIYATGGKNELVTRIGDRTILLSESGRQAHYMLDDGSGNMLAGDIRTWPRLSAKLSEQGFVSINGGLPVYARATMLDRDLKILVAREYGSDSAALARLSWIFLAVGAAIILLVALAARWTAKRLSWRVGRINDAYRTSAKGELLIDAHAALNDGSADDEIGELAQHSASVLARLSNMVTIHRHMSDHVAHEIRTPLMHLDNRLVNALKTSSETTASEIFLAARSDIRSITNMLDSLLDIAASEARKGDLSGLSEIDLSQLLRNLADLYAGSAEDAGLKFETDIRPDIMIRAEPMQITRMISNLLDNAIKYVPAGGTLSLSLQAGPQIVVSDDGPGIPPELQPYLFERFRRGANVMQATGHGLGLALAKAIAQRHAMDIECFSDTNGTCFTIQPAQGV